MKIVEFARKFSICFVLVAAVAGCDGDTADGRLAAMTFADQHGALTEHQVEQRIAELVPPGTMEPVLAKKALAWGIGGDRLSSYHLLPDRTGAVIRVEFDTSTFGWVKSAWLISFGFDKSGAVRSVKAQRYLTGL